MSSSACYPDKSPTVDRLLDTLSDNHCREVIHYFENVTGRPRASLDELVDHVASRVPDDDRETLRVRFAHVVLPKLAERGWLEFDDRQGTVRYRGHDSAQRLLADVVDVFAG